MLEFFVDEVAAGENLGDAEESVSSLSSLASLATYRLSSGAKRPPARLLAR
jgi:hypothetical protein